MMTWDEEMEDIRNASEANEAGLSVEADADIRGALEDERRGLRGEVTILRDRMRW